MRIGILGGGLTGLTLGYLLNFKAQYDILEQERECGGLLRTIIKEGFTFDYGGSHIIFSKDKQALKLMLSLIEKNKVKNRRNTRIFYRKNYIKYPFENGLNSLSKEDNYECLYYFLQNFIKKEKGKVSTPSNLFEWFYYTFGKGISEKYLIPYNQKIWKYPLDKMALDWVERIPNPPLEDIVKSSLGIQTEGYKHQLFFYYPKKGGIQAIIKTLENRIKGNIDTNYTVSKIKKEDKTWLVSDGKKEKSYDKIISTIPIHNLVKALDVPKEIETAVNSLKYNSLITVMIGLNKLKHKDLSWLYIPDKSILPHRVSFPANYSSNVCPKGKYSILAELTCNFGDVLWNSKCNDISSKVIDNLDDLGIIEKQHVCFRNIKKQKYAYVINDLNHKKNIKIIKNYMRGIGISLVGRFSEFKYLNMDACIKSAMNYLSKNYARTRALPSATAGEDRTEFPVV